MTTLKRGRPLDSVSRDAKKDLLLDAAYELLQEKTYRSITIREIAEQASMKSAMIAYYFDNKQGLFVALIERFASLNISDMQSAIASDDPLKSFIRVSLCHFSENPSLSRFIADEILFQDSPLADAIINAMPRKVATFLPTLISSLQERGTLRKDLNPNWAAFSLMTMIIMPFIAAKVRDKAWKITHEEVSSPQWLEHIYGLFMSGCANIPPNNTTEQ